LILLATAATCLTGTAAVRGASGTAHALARSEDVPPASPADGRPTTPRYWDGRGECPLADPFGEDIGEFDRFISLAEEHDDFDVVGRLNAYALEYIRAHYDITRAIIHIEHASREYPTQRLDLANPKAVLSDRRNDYSDAIGGATTPAWRTCTLPSIRRSVPCHSARRATARR
jgi:hypothetical protein